MTDFRPDPLARSRGERRTGSDDETLRQRWEEAGSALRERFDEPITKATELTRRTLAWFPVRVWRHFLRSNGFLLAASISYQSLFAIFAVIYVAFAGVGVWLGASSTAITRMIALINSYIPNLISEDGLVHPDDVAAIARDSGSVLAITGAIAVVVALWTAIGFVTFTRRAVRDIFGLPFDTRNYFLLKAKDLFAALLFGLSLVVGAAIGWLATGALDVLLGVLGLEPRSVWFKLLVKLLSVVVAFAVNSVALASLFRFLAGATLPWRRIWPGSILGGGALAILQVGVGFLFSYTPSNPLLGAFSLLIAFLLWFRLVGIVILVAASWIAVSATDRDIPVAEPSQAEQILAEHEALLLAAHVRLRDARMAYAQAHWYERWGARRTLEAAQARLDEIEASTPPPLRSRRG